MTELDPQKYSEYCIYRRRFIPDENILLKGDIIYHASPDLILSSWKTLKARDDFAGGLSAYYPKLGIKVSKELAGDGSLVYWYNDIMELYFEGTTIKMIDLLLDLIVYPDGSIKLLDADEFADAIEQGLVSKEQSIWAMRSLSGLLDIVYAGNYHTLAEPLDELSEYMKGN